MKTYPICLTRLEGRQAVVIGGGTVAARKVEGLLEAGAQIRLVSPWLAPELERSATAGQVAVVRRVYQDGDLESAFLVIAATGDHAVNQAVAEEASRRGCLVNVVDDPALSNFILPAVLRRGDVAISITTGGASPALARRLRERLESEIGPEYAQLACLLAELRPVLHAHFTTSETRLAAALGLVDSDLLEILRTQGTSAARHRAKELLESWWESSLTAA